MGPVFWIAVRTGVSDGFPLETSGKRRWRFQRVPPKICALNAGLSPFELVRRTAPVMILALIMNVAASAIFL